MKLETSIREAKDYIFSFRGIPRFKVTWTRRNETGQDLIKSSYVPYSLTVYKSIFPYSDPGTPDHWQAELTIQEIKKPPTEKTSFKYLLPILVANTEQFEEEIRNYLHAV